MIEKSFYFKAASKNEIDLKYIIYTPSNYNENTEHVPLILFLHGAGERGDNLDLVKTHGIPKLINEGRTFPFICIAPQSPLDGYWNRPEYTMSLISLIKKVSSDYNVDINRVYGTGLSMGGLGILAIAIEEPKLFAAILPICGGADLNKIDRINGLPIWLFHGDRDDVIPVENSISIFQRIKHVNKDAFLTIYGGVYHDSWTQTYENFKIYDWLLNYRK